MKENRNQIAKILMKNGLKPNYKYMQSEDLPRSVFFLVSNVSVTSSNTKKADRQSFQISYFSKTIDDDVMAKVQADLVNIDNAFVSNWQEGPIEDETNLIFHHYLEVEFIG